MTQSLQRCMSRDTFQSRQFLDADKRKRIKRKKTANLLTKKNYNTMKKQSAIGEKKCNLDPTKTVRKLSTEFMTKRLESILDQKRKPLKKHEIKRFTS